MSKHTKFKTTLYDTKWLTEHYISQKLNTKEIADLLKCSPRTVMTALKGAGISVRSHAERHRESDAPRGPKNMCQDTLGDEAWLRKNWLECYSFTEVGRRAKASKVAVRNRMEPIFKGDPTLPRVAPAGFHPPSPYAHTILNEDWLRATWLELRNVSQVAAKAGCSNGYVSTHLKKLLAKEPELPKPMTTGEKTAARKAGLL